MKRARTPSDDGTISVEWADFRQRLVDHRRVLERTLRRELVHDPRATGARTQNVAVRDLADEAICWALDQWRAKPAATSPEQWTRKHGLQLLDEALDREALAAESRVEERAAESRVLAYDLHDNDEERERWLEVAELATARRRAEPESPEAQAFDGLACDPAVSSPENRLDDRELLAQVERALLRLPELRRKAVAHRYLDGLSAEEIAYLLDTSVERVEREVADGIRALRRDLTALA